MSTTQQISKIASLVQQLGPLAGKSRGMRIEADEWNALVDVVGGALEVEKLLEDSLQVELAGEFAPKIHHHTGEIGLDALDPELQAQIGGASGNGIQTRMAIADMQARVDALGAEVGRVTAALEQTQGQLDKAAADTLAKSAKLDGFEDRFKGIEDLRGLVAAVTSQVHGLRDGVDAFIKLRSNPGDVDVAGLQQRVTTLERYTDNLNGVDGKPVRLVDVEVNIKELQDALDLSPGNSLDDRVNALKGDLSASVDQQVQAGLEGARTDLAAQVAAAQTDLSAQLAGQIDASRTSIEAGLDEKLAATQASLDDALATKVDAAAASLGDSLLAQTGALVDERFAGLPAQIQAAVSAAGPGLQETVLGQLTEQLNASTAALQADLAERTDALSTQFAQQAAQLPSLVADQASELLPGLVGDQMATASAQLSASLGARIDQQLTAARNAIAIAIQTQVGEQLSGALGDLDARIAAQVQVQLGDLDGRIAASTADALESLPDQIGKEVGAQLDRLELDGRMTQLETTLARSVDSLTASLSDLQAQTKSDLASLTEGMRTEIAAARDEAIKEAAIELDRTATDLRQQIADLGKRTLDQFSSLQATFASQLQQSVDAAVTKVETDISAATADVLTQTTTSIAAMRDSVTADFGAELEKSQTTLEADIASANAATLSKATAAVTTLSRQLTPRLDTLESKVLVKTTTLATAPVVAPTTVKATRPA
jgi:hypothetical protein